jgi:hypothetical protein
MQKQYLHLSAYPCDNCGGPVVSGSLTVRENEISKETAIRELGSSCLGCGRTQCQPATAAGTRQFAPVEWGSVRADRMGGIRSRVKDLVARE